MIRFCDKEVYCVSYEQIDRSALLNYFFQGNMDEGVCVQNPDGTYRGWISYYSLIHCENVKEAVWEDCVVPGRGIWEQARKFFACHEYRLHENVLLPVTDQAGNLICFAYEDGEANREIRMLRELKELSAAIGFSDLYPQYDCVKICGCNELAVLFAAYLKDRGIAVKTEGELWEYFLTEDGGEYPDYQCLTIYAEGVEGKKSQNWVENLLRSVSPEFECVDCIYEENLKRGLIVNAMGSFQEWIDVLKNADKDIVIWGAGIQAQNVYDFLLYHGVACSYFLCDSYDDRERLLFGKKVIGPLEMRKAGDSIMMLDCFCKNSALGTYAIDYYDYLGYRRNKRLFAVKDYLEIPHTNLKTVLQGRSILLAGDPILCKKAAGYFLDTVHVKRLVYADILGETAGDGVSADCVCQQADLKDVEEDVLCLIVLPDNNVWGNESGNRTEIAKKRAEIICRLKEKGIRGYTDYFSRLQSFIAMENETGHKCRDRRFVPKRAVIGAIRGSSGNAFIKGLLDNHPSVLTISDFTFFSNHLFWLCIKLSDQPAEKLAESFENICRLEPSIELKDEAAFKEKMKTLLEPERRYTSQELFVILMISYVFMYGRDFHDARDLVVYWEPHDIARDGMGEFAKWLKQAGPCGILTVVRNACTYKGSMTKMICNGYYGRIEDALTVALECPDAEEKKDVDCEKYVFRFEDIKLHPREELTRLCQAWGIPWSETLMETTKYGEKVGYFKGGLTSQSSRKDVISGFDLKPVYDRYESFFSEYDRFRISLACAPYQKKYGYPYVEASGFTRRELQEMFLKKFRFEAEIPFYGAKEELEYRIRSQQKIRSMLWELRKTERKEDAAMRRPDSENGGKD